MDVAKMTSADLKKYAAAIKKDPDTKDATAAIGAALKTRQALAKDSKLLDDAVKKNPDV
jgi:hypothetical protein